MCRSSDTPAVGRRERHAFCCDNLGVWHHPVARAPGRASYQPPAPGRGRALTFGTARPDAGWLSGLRLVWRQQRGLHGRRLPL